MIKPSPSDRQKGTYKRREVREKGKNESLISHRPTQIYPVESRRCRVCFAEFNRASTDNFFSPVDLTGEKPPACGAHLICLSCEYARASTRSRWRTGNLSTISILKETWGCAIFEHHPVGSGAAFRERA